MTQALLDDCKIGGPYRYAQRAWHQGPPDIVKKCEYDGGGGFPKDSSREVNIDQRDA